MEAGRGGKLIYKVVEISEVCDERLEEALNDWTGKGFRFDSLHFVTQPGSRRPAMAFLFFTAAGQEAAE